LQVISLRGDFFVLQRTLEELKVTQEKLIQTEKMASMGQLTAGIAHEINNPINYITAGTQAIDGYLKRLHHKIESPTIKKDIEELSELLEDVRDGGIRVSKIIKHLRTFSHLDKAIVKKENLRENMESALTILQFRLGEGIVLERNYEEIPEVECNPAEINQVFLSILNNAVDAMGSSGTLKIGIGPLTNNGKEVYVSISDSGKGIPQVIRNKIFDPFFTTKDVGQGKGLSLSTSLAIIEEHGGSIAVKSEEGRGSTFIIHMPVQPVT
jgi:signal transduction histidine kinase